jgi:tRNA threonylcarbamoyladenosine biosynthesis protein TsaB
MNSASPFDSIGNALILDASGPAIKVGLWEAGKVVDEVQELGHAMDLMIPLCNQLLNAHDLEIAQLEALAYCYGPGSILGIRVATVIVSTWQTLHSKELPVYKFSSLHTARNALVAEYASEPYLVISEWRKGFWNGITQDSSMEPESISVWSDDQISDFQGNVFLLSQRSILKTETPYQKVDYRLASLDSNTLNESREFTVYTPEDKQYVKWSGERHKHSPSQNTAD